MNTSHNLTSIVIDCKKEIMLIIKERIHITGSGKQIMSCVSMSQLLELFIVNPQSEYLTI